MKHYYATTTTMLLALLMTPASALAFMEESVKITVRASESGTIADLATKTSQPVTADTDLEMTLTAPVMVDLKGRIPLMLIPVQVGTGKVELSPPTVKEVLAGPTQKEIGFAVSELMVGFTEVQRSLQKREVEKASFRLEELAKKYPQVQFLEFLRGSILLLQGNKAQAREAVTRALEAHPDFKEGQEFLAALGGPDAVDARTPAESTEASGENQPKASKPRKKKR